jgi:DNA-binding transcriptional ArsR family regulator
MSLTMVFGPDDPGRTRFVISPVWETMHAIRVIAESQRHLYHLPWLEAVRPQAEQLDLRVLLTLTPRRGWTPDFLSPVPDTPDADIASELARVQATPPEQVAHEVRRSLTERYGAPLPPGAWQLLDDPAATRDLVADLLAQCWQLLVEPHWPRLRDRIEADVAYRTRTLADYGLERMLNDLHPRVRWTGRALVIKGFPPARCHLGGAGLLLMPSAFGWPSLAPVIDPPSRPALAYPARGIAELWQPARTPQSDALARLLGRTRAALLESLAEPASTHTLARRHSLAPSTVSEHLSALRDARLVTSRRQRHAVMYQQTRLGMALASGG